MYTHEEIWIAIDRLAKASGHSTSGLAIKAGLDPTSFNKSKRFQPNKKPRWPSMESISKILTVTQTTMDDFIALIKQPSHLTSPKQGQMPLLSLSHASDRLYFTEEGIPISDQWDKLSLGGIIEDGFFAFEIDDDALSPLYRVGEILIIAPDIPIKTNDRAVFKLHTGEVILGVITQKRPDSYHLVLLTNSDNAQQEHKLQKSDILWHGRIAWVSQ
jgi:phage repressor protein C with HTH and peptisase S24 domain